MIYELKSGQKIEANKEELMNDFLFVRAVQKMQSKNEARSMDGFFEAWARVFADEEKEEAYYASLAEKNGGRVPQEIVVSDFSDLLEQMGEEVKNS